MNRQGIMWRSIVAAWMAFMAAMWAGGELKALPAILIAAGVGAVLVWIGYAAASRCRVLLENTTPRRAQLTMLSLAAGVVLGVANLAANWGIAQIDPAVRTLLVERMATLGPIEAVVASPIVEEISLRLFLMSVIAWTLLRFGGSDRLVFVVALVGSALAFALLHLIRPFPGDPSMASAYRAALLAKYTLAGIPLGWIFWRWGLPYAILAHAVTNATHLLMQKFVF